MKPLYNYKPYDHPKKGLFKIETDEYSIQSGWVRKEEVFTIIGECDHTFVYRLQPSTGNDLSSEKIKYILPIGIHKSRFVRWISGQLTLF